MKELEVQQGMEVKRYKIDYKMKDNSALFNLGNLTTFSATLKSRSFKGITLNK